MTEHDRHYLCYVWLLQWAFSTT
eukprot:COSAG06_NODE_67341_length_252_cov_0.673203_1_plen_22_part_01